MPNCINAPTELSGLALWCRADQGIVLEAATQKVEQWQDFSGNARHLLQAATGLKPLISTGPNGQPAVLFDGVDDFLRASFAIPQPTTLVIVYKYTFAVGHDCVCDGGTSANGTPGLYEDNLPQTYLYANGAFTMSIPTTVANNVYAILTGFYSGTSSFMRVNGAQRVQNGAAIGTTAGAALTLGATFNGTRSSNIAVAEVILYNRALTPGEITMVERYLARRYALTAQPRVPTLAASDIPGLVGWYKAGQGLGFESGTGKIAAWNDLSGLDHHLLQPLTAKRPTLADGPVGRPAVLFDGVDDFLQALFVSPQPQTLVVILKSVVDAKFVVDGGVSNFLMGVYVNAAILYAYNGSYLGSSPGSFLNTYMCITMVFNGATSVIRCNGVQIATGAIGTTTAGGLTVGALAGGGTNANIFVPELALYNRALSTPEMQRLEHSWGAAYGVPVA